MVPAGNRAKRLSSVNHTTKRIHHHHHHHATKAYLKNATGINTSKLAAKSDLVSLKAVVDKLDIVKLIPVPVDLSKLSDVVKNDLVKKTVYRKLVAKVSSTDTSGFVLKT